MSSSRGRGYLLAIPRRAPVYPCQSPIRLLLPSHVRWLIISPNGRRPAAADDRQQRRLHDAPPALSPPSCFYSDSSVRASGSAAPGTRMCCGIFSNNGIQDMRSGWSASSRYTLKTLKRAAKTRAPQAYVQLGDSTQQVGSPRVRISSWKNIPPLLEVVRPKKACVHGLRYLEAVSV